MILDPNGMPILQPAIDNAETATFNTAFAAIGNLRAIKTYKWANATARGLQIGMSAGDMGYQTDNKVYYAYTGAAWESIRDDTGWVGYTPDFQNITLGNGTKTGRLRKEGKTVDFWARFQLGSTSAMGTSPYLNLPYAGAGGSPSALDGYMLDNGSTWLSLMPLYNGTSVNIYSSASVGGINQTGAITATTPITWTTGDYVEVRGRYESAT